MNQLTKEVHYYTDANGNIVFTETFLLARGYCCGNGCRHCPFEKEKVQQVNPGSLSENKTEQ